MSQEIYSRETVTGYLDRQAAEYGDRVWLRDRKGDEFNTWTWSEARDDIHAIAAWLEQSDVGRGANCAILSRNRAHWMMADTAIIAAGKVSVPIFTTHDPESARYILEFADIELLFVGEAENWERVRRILPPKVRVVALPGVDPGIECAHWDDILTAHSGQSPTHRPEPGDLMTIAFTSGTTGVPKGVMQTHDSMIMPMERCMAAMRMRDQPRFLSYLPLAHIAERQLVWIQSLIYAGEVTFNESLQYLARDMAECRPTYLFGAPRVWEQLQQGIIARFGSQSALDAALQQDPEGTGRMVREALGLQDPDYLLTAAAPTPAALIDWWERLGVTLMEGYGQTEAMGLIGNLTGERRVGSIGKPVEDVEVRIAEDGELLCKAEGLSPGYYRQPGITAETFVDGWVRTGDKARVDEEGFYYITGRVKDYFKTIHGKFVAPGPIENAFAGHRWVEQLCLLGRGYAKTVMLCVLSAQGREQDPATLASELRAHAEKTNAGLDKHARIGAVLLSSEPWTIENGLLTPTLKIRRNELEGRYGEGARLLAQDAAARHEVLVEQL